MQEYIARDGDKYTLLMSENPIEEKHDEIITDFSFTEEDRAKLVYTNELDSNLKPIETQGYLDNIIVESKQAKSEAIQKVASLTDQLNLLASVLDIITEGNTDPVVVGAKSKFTEIKNILNK